MLTNGHLLVTDSKQDLVMVVDWTVRVHRLLATIKASALMIHTAPSNLSPAILLYPYRTSPDRDGGLAWQEVREISSISKRQGRLVSLRGLEEIRRLPTLHSVSVGAQPGDMLKRVAGVVTLIDEDIQSIERDITVIRALERDGIFEVEDELQASMTGDCLSP